MTKARKTRATNKRREIINASAKLFDRVGFHGASMQMIADEVKLGKPTLYHYFRSKNEILFALHQGFIKEVLDAHLARKEKGLPPEELLTAMCADILNNINDHPGHARAFIEHFDELDAEQRQAARTDRSRYLSEIVDIIKEGIESGLLRKCDPRLAALGFLGMCNWSYKWLPAEPNRNPQRIARELSRTFLHGLLMNP